MFGRAWKRIPRPLRWAGGIILSLVLLYVAAGLFDWNAARGPLSRLASRRLERRVTIGGPLQVKLFSSAPSVSIDNFSIANPDWTGGGDLLQVQHLGVAVELSQLFRGRVVLRMLDIDAPTVSLVRDASGRANWDLGSTAQKNSRQPTRLPPIRHFELRGAQLTLDDAIRKLSFTGMIAANESGGGGQAEPFHLEGHGTLNKQPFNLSFEGGALLNLRLNQPYDLQVRVDSGAFNAAGSASIAKPFDFGALDADLKVQGQNLANLYYFTGLALPLTPPYQVSLQVHRAGAHFELRNIVGKIGSSDLGGGASVDLAADGRPSLKATIVSKSLNLGDLGVAFGAGMSSQGNEAGSSLLPAPASAPTSPLLLPTFEFQFDRLNAMDASLSFRADSVQTQKLPLKRVAFNLQIDHGVLNIDPVDFELPLGKLAGQVHLDTRSHPAHAAIDMRLSDLHLDQFKGKGASEAPLSGIMQSRARLEGRGNSVHAIAADSNGTITVVVPQGEIRRSLAELTGINVLTGIGLLVSKSDQTAPIRCGVANFQVKDGDARVERFVIDTQPVLINVDGHINLSDEMLDLNIAGKPKKLHLVRLRTPINIRGTMRHPSFGISAPAAIKQVGAGAALGVLLTPVAAVLAFIDPGLAKDQNCTALLEQGGADPPAAVSHEGNAHAQDSDH